MILFSDLHLCEESAETVFGQVLPGLFRACIERKDYEIACLGDIWHIRYKIDARLQNLLRDELVRWTLVGIRITILPGNHDQYEIDGRNALEVLGHIAGIQVYTVPTRDSRGLWVPYRKDISEIQVAIREVPESMLPLGEPTLFLHHGIQGAWMNDKVYDTKGVKLEDIGPQWQTVLCGHYHRHQKMGNRLWYIGSPYQTSVHEAGDPKGYCIWDGKQLTFVPQDWGRRYYVFEVAPGQNVDLSGVRPGDEVRVKTTGSDAEKDAKRIGTLLAQAGIVKNTVTPDIPTMQARLGVADGATMRQYAAAYIDKVAIPESMDKVKLLNTFCRLSGVQP